MQASSARLFCSSSCSAALRQQAKHEKKAVHLLQAVSTRKTQKQRALDGSDPVAAAVYAQPNEDASTYLSPFFRPSFDLAQFNQILDIHPEAYSNPSPNARVVHINSPSSPLFSPPPGHVLAQLQAQAASDDGENADPLRQLAEDKSLNLSLRELRELHRYPLVVRRVVNMTSKGKQPSMSVLVVAGNGKGLLGYGEGKSENVTQAADKAFVQAVKNMDFVQRRDNRTIWSESMKAKWGATVVEMRSRPPGFGLRTSPIIHQIAKAAGILDLSAKIRGSRNGMNTVKATVQLLHGGAAPQGLGDLSGKDRLARRFKGSGMRTAPEIGLDLGRRVRELR